MKPLRTVFILFILLSCSMLTALEPKPLNNPESIAKFIEGWNKKSKHIAAEGLAEDFHFQDYSPEISDMILGKIFPLVQDKFLAYLVSNSVKDGSETKYSVVLISDTSADEVYFWINNPGKITHTTLFDIQQQQAKTNLNLMRNKYSSIAINVQNGIILMDGELDGVKGSFVLDNGTAVMKLNRKYFTDKLTPVTMCDPASEANVGLVRAKKFVWGAGTYLNLDLTTADLTAWETALGVPILGTIGMSELAAFETKIDYEHNVIELFLLDDKGEIMTADKYSKPTSQMKVSFSKYLPVVKAKIGGKAMKLGIDLSMTANLIDSKHLTKLQKVLTATTEQPTANYDNTVIPMQTGMLPKNSLGKYNAGDLRFAFGDLSGFNGNSKAKLDGLIGYGFLSHVPFSINYRKMTVSFY